MKRFTCKKTAGKLKQAVKEIAMSFSKYVDSLVPLTKENILRKTKIIDDTDPHAIEEEEFIYTHCFPTVTYPDIVNCLIFGTIPFSAEDMKANKSLDAYS